MRSRFKIGVINLFAVIAALGITSRQTQAESLSCDSYQMKTVPRYRIARQLVNGVKHTEILYVSISPKQNTRDNLIALACGLAREHARDEIFGVFMFDDFRAAKRYSPQGEGNDLRSIKSFVGTYIFDRSSNRQTFTWYRKAGDASSSVEIDLGDLPANDG